MAMWDPNHPEAWGGTQVPTASANTGVAGGFLPGEPPPGSFPSPRMPGEGPYGSGNNRAGIAAAYQQYLGRTPNETDYQAWVGNNNYLQGIMGSPEAQAYARSQGKPGTGVGAPAPGNYRATEDSWINYLQSLTTPQGNVSKGPGVYQSRPGSGFYHQGGTNLQDVVNQYNAATGGHATYVGGPSGDMVDFGDGRGPVDVLNAQGNYWYDEGAGANRIANAGSGTPGAGGSSAGGGVSGTGNVFTDPATSEWETMLRQLVDRLNQPQPTWTPAQLELQQTQIMDPLQRQQDAARQNTIQQLAARGIAPTSGPAIQALADVDRQFQQLRTQQQSGLAQQALNRQDVLFNTNEQRAQQALQTLFQIPQLQDQRLAQAQSSIQPLDATSLAAILSQLQNQQYNQQFGANVYSNQQMQQFWQELARILGGAFSG